MGRLLAQLSYNFFLSTMLAIREADLTSALMLATELANAKLMLPSAGYTEEEVEASLRRRSSCCQQLGNLLVFLTNMSQCLGAGHATLLHKVKA